MENKNISNIIERIKAQQSMKTVAQASTGSITLKNASVEGRSSGSTGVIDIKTVSVGNYLYLDSYNQDGGMFESPILGYYNGEAYALFGYVDMDALLAENNIPLEDLTDCYLTIYGVSGNFTWAYSIYDANGNFVGHNYGNGTEVYVPLKAIYDSCGVWEFALVPATGSSCLYFSGEADAQISYSYYPTIEVNKSVNIQADDYVNLISVDQTGRVGPGLYLGEYNYVTYGLAVSVNMNALLSDNNILMSNIDNYNMTLDTVYGELNGWYEIISNNGTPLISGISSGTTAVIPLKTIYDQTGSWNFIIVPRSYQEAAEMSDSPTIGILYREEMEVTGIEISSAPIKTTYLVGDKLDLNGLVVKAICADGTKVPITDYTVNLTRALQITDTSFNVSYKGYMVGRGIQVNAVGKEGYFGNKNVSGSTYGNNPTFNLATMGMKYVESGLTIGVNSYAIGVNLVYESQMKSKLQDMCKGMPKDWKLDAHQFVVKDGKDDNDVDTYKYIDGQGYVHTFEFYDATYNKYYDTDGAGLTLVKNTNGYQIYDESNNAMTFNADGRLTQVSMPSTGSVKCYVYENGYLKRIYDNRKSSRKIELSYADNQLVISSYDGSTQKETLTCSYGDNKELVSVSKTVSGTSKTLKKFTYDTRKKLSLIQDVITGDGIKITHSFNTLFNEYTVYQFEYGYISNNAFQTKSFARFGEYNVQTSDYKTLREVQCLTSKGVRTSYMLNGKGKVINAFERVSAGQYRSLSLQTGKSLEIDGTVNGDLLNGRHGIKLVYGAIDIFQQIAIDELDKCPNVALKMRLKLKSVCQHAYAKVFVTTSGEEKESKKIRLDASAYESWQDVYLPFNRGNNTITQIRIAVANENSNPLDVEVSDFYLVKQQNSSLYFKAGEEEMCFDQFTKVQVYSSPNICSEEYSLNENADWYITENDILKTLKNWQSPKAVYSSNFDLYFNNGTKRKTGGFALKIAKADGTGFFIISPTPAQCFVRVESVDGKVTTDTYYAFTNTQISTTTQIKAKVKENEEAEEQIKESTTAKVVDYYGKTQSETNANGVVTTYEYHSDGRMKKQTMTSGTQSMILYENTQSASADGKYDILTDKSFNLGEKYTYENLYGTLDKVEKLCYNGNTETVYNTTNYGYDSYRETLLNVSSTADNQTHTNTLTYEDGELSTVTDGKVNYKFTYDRATDKAAFKVKDGSNWKTLEEAETDEESNTVTHKYYRNDSATASDTIKKVYDEYGLPLREYNNSTQKVTYGYYSTNTSEATKQLASMVDGYTGTTTEYYYNTDGAVQTVRKLNTATNTTLFEIEKASENETQYYFSAEGKTYKTQVITDAEKPGSNQVTYTTLTEGGNEDPKDILSWKYTYDHFGRLESKTNKMGLLWDANYVYEYNEDSTISGIDYHGSVLFNNDYLLLSTSCEYAKGQITKITEEMEVGPLLSRQSTTRVQNYTYDNHGRLKTAQIVSDGTVQSDNRYTYDNNGRLTQIYLAHNGLTRNQEYDDRGRITSSFLNSDIASASAISYRYQYDNYGNRTAKTYYHGSNTIQSYEWERGRLLKNIKNTSGNVVASYTYDLNGVRYTKTADGVTTTYFYNGNTLLGENKSNGTRLRYFYDASGLCGFSYFNGSETKFYTYVKDVLGNIVMIKDDMGVPLVRYTYNEWGVCFVEAFNLNNNAAAELALGNLNPFRYRGYYYDSESNLYYLMSRYYDPEIGQFISMDAVAYLKPETIGGVDLYAYGLNNPVMYVDPTGHSPEWLQIAGWIGLGVGIVLCGVAIGILTGGVGTVTLMGAIAVGAAKGALIGAAIGIGAGAVAGATGSLIAGESLGSSEFWNNTLFGAMALFGIGAIIGAVAGGVTGANAWYNAKALEFTNYGSSEVVLGRSPGYVEIAKNRGATYFHTTDDIWKATQSMRGVGSKGMWRINKAFLKQQIKAGAHFTLANPSSGFFYAKEVAYVMKYAIYVFL